MSSVFATGLFFPEGPVALPDGTWLMVEGGERGCVTQISADGKQRCTVAVTGLPNGLAVDSAGFIWVAEPKVPSLLRVTLDGNPVKLTSLEYRLLSYLAHHKGRVVSRTELVEHLYDQDFDRDSNTIEVFVGRLRKKLDANLIQTVRGLGYCLDIPGAAQEGDRANA